VRRRVLLNPSERDRHRRHRRQHMTIAYRIWVGSLHSGELLGEAGAIGRVVAGPAKSATEAVGAQRSRDGSLASLDAPSGSDVSRCRRLG
jgi:hypothetical protein